MKENKPPMPVAVALTYDGDNAPIVSAKGHGLVAEQILKVAKEHNVPLHQDEHLTALLSKIDLGDAIPEQLYTAVARILAFIYSLQNKKI